MLELLQQLSTTGVKYASYLLGAAAAFIFVYAIFPNEDELAARRRLGVEHQSGKPTNTFLFKLLYPVYTTVASLFYLEQCPAWLTRWIERKRPGYDYKLTITGQREEISPDEFIAFRLVMTFLVPVLIFYMFGAMGINLSPLITLAIWLFGFFYADLWLNDAVQKRKKAIVRALPFTLDLLTLSVEAGMDFTAAVQRMIERSKSNAMLEELEIMMREIRLGTARSDALRNMSQRLDIEQISSFTSLMIQSDQMGSDVGDVLRAQADQLRTKRFQMAETEGAKASQKVLFPMVIFIFPAVFIVIMGPLVIKFLVQGLM
jgi:tight adherence protein C